MKKITYSSWFRAKKKLGGKKWSEETAQQLHENREHYGIVIGDTDDPECFIEINDSFVLVGFLDDLKREYLNYEFDEIEPNKIFLKEAQYWEYDGDTDEKILSTRYRFSPSGKLVIEKTDIRTNDVEISEAKEPVDVSSHYEDYPAFGHYEDITKIERISV